MNDCAGVVPFGVEGIVAAVAWDGSFGAEGTVADSSVRALDFLVMKVMLMTTLSYAVSFVQKVLLQTALSVALDPLVQKVL